MISRRTTALYRKIRAYVNLVESSHNTICSRGLRAVKEFGDTDIIEEFNVLLEERKENSQDGALATAEGYTHDVFILGKLATLSGQVDIAMECASIVKLFRDEAITLHKVLNDIKLSQLHEALCANAYNN